MKNKYNYTVFWSDDDEQYIGVCKELPSLSSFGDTYIEAMESILELVDASLEILEEQDLPIPEPIKQKEASGRCLLRMPKSLHEAVFNRSEEDSVSVNTVLINAVSAYIYQSQVRSYVDQLERLTSNMTDLYERARIGYHRGEHRKDAPIDNQEDTYST